MQSVAINYDHFGQAGHLLANLQELVQLFIIFNQQKTAVRVVDEIF